MGYMMLFFEMLIFVVLMWLVFLVFFLWDNINWFCVVIVGLCCNGFCFLIVGWLFCLCVEVICCWFFGIRYLNVEISIFDVGFEW